MTSKYTDFETTLITHAYGGEALGRMDDGRAVFIPFALPGERVRARVIEQKRSHARAQLLEVLEPAPERIQPRCPHFGECGGCHYQHLSYPFQLQVKTQVLADQLKRIAHLENPPLRTILAASEPFKYRNHIQFGQAPDGKLGFHHSRSDQIFPVQNCYLPEEPITFIWQQLDLEVIPGLERLGIRLGRDEDIQLILESSLPEAPELLVEELPISAVHLFQEQMVVLAGSDHVVIEVLGRPFYVSAGSFFQVNTQMAEKMVNLLLNELPLNPKSIILDVYCGVGLFSAFLAPLVSQVVGVEISPLACDDFSTNLDEFDHVELYQASAEEALPHLAVHPDVVIVDPPRAGLGRPALDSILGMHAPHLVYISCDPATLARDAARLIAGGYQIEHITPVDMFPQTYHIESISFWRSLA